MDRALPTGPTPTTPARRMGMPRSAAVGMLLWPQTGSSRRRFCSRGYSETSHSGRGLIKGAGDDPARPSDPAPEPVGRPLRRARGRPSGPQPYYPLTVQLYVRSDMSQHSELTIV